MVKARFLRLKTGDANGEDELGPMLSDAGVSIASDEPRRSGTEEAEPSGAALWISGTFKVKVCGPNPAPFRP